MSDTIAVPMLHVGPRPPGDQADPLSWDWSLVASLPPFQLVETCIPATQQTDARVCYDGWGLYIR
jgi:hypothetical protein